MMKKQKGITLISLTIYIIGLTFVLSIIAVVSSYFYKNVDTTNKQIEPLTEYTKFTSFFTEFIEDNDTKVLECGEDYIVFNNGVQYTYVQANKGIYYNKVKICRDVRMCTFEYNGQNGKGKIILKIKIGNSDIKTTEYTLKN